MVGYASLLDLMRDRAREIPGRTAYTFLSYTNDREQAVQLTFSDVDTGARRIAADMQRRGLQPGDRVVIITTQTRDNVLAVWGSMYAGAVFSLIPPPIDQQKQERFRSVLESARPRFVMGGRLVAQKLQEKIYQEVYSRLPRMLLNVMPGGWRTRLARALVKWNKGLEIYDVDDCRGDEARWKPPDLEQDTVACLQYSSGSTAAPKGVMLSHGNFLHNLRHGVELVQFEDGDTFLGWIPFFHNMGLTVHILIPVYTRSNSVIMSPLDFKEKPVRWFQALAQWKANLTSAPNSIYRLCARIIQPADIEGLDLSNMKIAANGSESIDYRSLEAFAELFGPAGFPLETFAPGYGLAEFTTIVSAAGRGNPTVAVVDGEALSRNEFAVVNAEHSRARTIVAVGRVLPGIKVMIVDPDTEKPCGPNEIGEIWLQGPSTAQGYWRKPEETAATFRNKLPGHDGYWLRTGDLGIVYRKHLYITGRIKELINIHGKNYYSDDIEGTIKGALPQLVPYSVISFSAESGGEERLFSCVEGPERDAAGCGPLAGEIGRVTAEAYGFSQHDIVFVAPGTLPRTDNNKIKIVQCRQDYLENRWDVLFSLKEAGALPSEQRSPAALPESELEREIVEAFTGVLRTGGQVSMDDRFFDVGGDSLAATELLAAVNGRYRVKVPMKLFFEEPTPRHLTHIVRAIARDGSTANVERKHLDLRGECVLPEEIRPAARAAHLGAGAVKLAPTKNIFLTGTTGFLGAYLITELLDNTDAVIYCHVRARNEQAAMARLKYNLKFYFLWTEECLSRLIPVTGDLNEPLLGIPEDRFEELADTVDTVVHNGALLNFIYPYTSLKKTNVFGTQEALRLACRGKPKRYHHVSTFSVFDTPDHFGTVAREDDPLESCDGYFLGYTESKWVAEKLVMIAGDRGLPVTIYRPGEITGDGVLGVWPMNDLVIRFLISCVQFGIVPDLDVALHMTPVDYVSRAMVHLLQRDDSAGKAYHLVNNEIMPIPEIAAFLKGFGYDVELVPYRKWKEKLFVFANDSALKLVESLFTEERKEGESLHERYGKNQPAFDCSNTLTGLAGSDIACPPVTEDLLESYFTFFIKSDYIPKPRAFFQKSNYLAASELNTDLFTGMMREHSGDGGLVVTAAQPADSEIGSTIIMQKTAALKSKVLGFLPYRLRFRTGAGEERECDVMLKSKATDADVINAMRTATVLMPDNRLAEEFKYAGGVANFQGCHIRELAVFQQKDPRFARNAPEIYGVYRDDEREIYLILMEHLRDMVLMNTVEDVSGWTPEHVACALDGIAEIHSIWYGREEELKQQEWIGDPPTRSMMERFQTLWSVVARHARQEFSLWFRGGDLDLLLGRIRSIPEWWGIIEEMPKTLIHNDFNPRNMAFRKTGDGLRLCAFDWELATIHLPQHDVVELLAFVLDRGATREQLVHFADYHRRALERYTGLSIDAEQYWTGFRCCTWDFLVNRGSFLILANTINRYPWMNRVPFTLRRMLDLVRDG